MLIKNYAKNKKYFHWLKKNIIEQDSNIRSYSEPNSQSDNLTPRSLTIQ